MEIFEMGDCCAHRDEGEGFCLGCVATMRRSQLQFKKERDEYKEQLDKLQPQPADRYTVIMTNLDEIGKVAEACNVLGLAWFVHSDRPRYGMKKCSVYVFFDYAGMHNYLRGHYEPGSDIEDEPPTA